MKMVSGEERCLDVLENARQIERFFASAIDGQLIAGIGMAHDARGGGVPKDPREFAIGRFGAIGQCHHPCMLGIADADAATAVDSPRSRRWR